MSITVYDTIHPRKRPQVDFVAQLLSINRDEAAKAFREKKEDLIALVRDVLYPTPEQLTSRRNLRMVVDNIIWTAMHLKRMSDKQIACSFHASSIVMLGEELERETTMYLATLLKSLEYNNQ